MAINEPGNTYQFLEVGEAAAKARMVWNPNAASTAAPQELLNLYESLMRATSTLPNNN